MTSLCKILFYDDIVKENYFINNQPKLIRKYRIKKIKKNYKKKRWKTHKINIYHDPIHHGRDLCEKSRRRMMH